MFIENTNILLDSVGLTDETIKEFEVKFRSIAGSRLSECKDVKGLLSSCGISVNGSSEELTREFYLNSIILIFCEGDSKISLSNDRAIIFAKKDGKEVTKLGLDELSEWFLDYVGLSNDSEDSKEKDGKLSEEDIEGIKSYYNQFYKGVVNELAKRYTSLFESGYEVVKPAGILSENGMIGLSGNKLVVKKKNVSVIKMYSLFNEKLGFIEVPHRSNIKIADTIYDYYKNKGKSLLYFPNKLLEYAYGRKAPSGDNQDSVNTYENHSDSANWSAYCKREVIKSLISVVSSSVVKFIYLSAEGNNYYDESLSDELQDYLIYLQRCLSLCLLMVEYKSKVSGVNEDIFAFKVRVCDPCDSLGTYDLTMDIINRCFMGSTGDVPFSYQPRIEYETYIKEYAHEFNHDSSQASPLFAYKAFLSLQQQGVEPTWNNMILGMFEDGTILKNGKKGVSLNNKLTHHICAGSRAGKGVMTLNILASGIYSNRNIFYLDRKPDMASMFKYLSPSMFIVNGASYDPGNDKPYFTFQNQDSWVNHNNIPDYLCDILECGKSWTELGDIFYMRALKLVMGIILARGDGKLHDPNFGGDDGILLVVDEFKNFQEGYSSIINRMKSRLPAKSMASDRSKLSVLLDKKKGNENDEEYKDALNKFNRSYNNANYYALSYLNSMVKDLEFLSTKRDAGFNADENRLSDIFVIGQNLAFGDMDLAGFSSMISSGRYKGMGDMGVKSGGETVDLSTNSFGYSMVSFKTCDAFFGRNMEDGREVYLAQRNKSSKAYGRLDDKASNFAYMETFTNEKRLQIVGGRPQENIALANDCVFFKPFLVLNDAKEGDDYTSQMFSRCAGPNLEEPWISREEIIAENPNSDGTFVNEAVGYEGYLRMMGITDYNERLAKSGTIADYVVKNCLGYPGTWLEFVTDLRPEWLFSIKDVVEGARNGSSALNDVANNPVLSEFVSFNPDLFGLANSEEFSDSYDDYGSTDDLSVSDFMGEEDTSTLETENYNLEDDFDSMFDEPISDEEEVDLFSDDEDDFYTPVVEDTEEVLRSTGSKESEIQELLNRLKQLGYDVPEAKTTSELEYDNDVNYGQRATRVEDDGYVDYESADESIYNISINSLDDLVNLVTNDVLRRFGGLEQIVSLKVLGGSIVVNGYYYKCKLGELSEANIPYDVKREVNAGNISRLFNFSLLRNMPRLRDLEFDSTSFVYDYVSYALGYGSHISVDLFFKDLRALQCLCIGKKLFRRETHMEQIKNDDVFYKPRLATKFANYSEEVLGRVSKNSWSFTKNTMKSKDYGAIMKTLGVTGGLMAASVSAGGRLGIKGGRKLLGGLRTLTKSFKDIIDETKKY